MATDNFNRDNGGLGANWTTCSNVQAPQISSNQVVQGSDESGAYWSADSFNDDQYSKIKVVTSADWMATIVRFNPGAQETMYALFRDYGTTLAIYVRSAGSWTQLGSVYGPIAVPNGSTFKLSVTGETLTPAVDDVDLATRSSAAIASGAPGFRVKSPAVLDDWEGGNVGGAPATVVPQLMAAQRRFRL